MVVARRSVAKAGNQASIAARAGGRLPGELCELAVLYSTRRRAIRTLGGLGSERIRFLVGKVEAGVNVLMRSGPFVYPSDRAARIPAALS